MRPRDWWALAALTGLAWGVRLWQLDTLPPGYWYDEAHKVWGALQILRGEMAPIYVTDVQGIEAGYFWLLAGWLRLGGAHSFGSRELTALIGAITIPMLFFTARMLYRAHPQRQRVAWFAALWLSFLLWHVHWSRLGLETILVPFFAVAVVGGVLGAALWRHPIGFFLVGGLVGLSQYTNPGARILPLLALGLWALWPTDAWRQRFAHGGWLALGAALVYAPLGWFFWQNPEWFNKRMAFASAQTAASGGWFYLINTWRVVWGLVGQGDSFARHNLAWRPALDGFAVLALGVGVGGAWRDRPYWRIHATVFVIIGLTLLPSALSDGAPVFGRMLAAAPFVVVVPALGIVTLLGQAPVWFRAPGWRLGLAAVAFLGSLGLNLYDYFVRYPQQPGLFDAFENGLWQLTQRAATAAAQGPSYLVVSEAELAHPATKLTQTLTSGNLRVVNAQTCWVTTAWTDQPAQWAVLAPWRDRLLQAYAGYTDTLILHSPEPYPYAAVLTLPAGFRQPDLPPPLAQIGDWAALQAVTLPTRPVTAGEAVALSLRWLTLTPTPVRYTVFMHLASATQPYITGADSQPCQAWYPTDQWQAGEWVDDTLTLTVPTDLAPGEYQLALGLYDLATGERLPVAQNPPYEADRILGGTLTIK
jgi:hypothetical protein